ncbi:phosphoribosylformylglycinamidine cyclo-ligase [Candidatus Nitronereus thalassa]|uniref:Phosphoribosylformylglycinamidine cyclo-ligase n=1 Tax=Candidatus Nitronereus thalassa TaxID=3020898 RepID=A0ABU3K4D5_9BACT|nr:phosphoribosylformylglycinamidine cyclo-ligase [Candidatus Nitronereus thalassa]MDT7041225.1 phosphoribosylformylglycinamidine cyclo-ligase [Candidatus Nitronereus thalassa]
MTTYRQAGVDIAAGDEVVRRIRPLAKSTFRPEVLGDIGSFGGLFRLGSERFVDPVLVSGTDGVGTKLKVAFLMDRHDTVGIDLVAMCVNDIIVSGAEPLFFLDYLAVGELVVDKGEAIVKGIAEGCRQAGCALIGGETAELPSFYQSGEYDLAGFAVGVVERANILSGENIQPGDAVIGLASSGLHSNGFSLARRVLLDQGALPLESTLPNMNETVGEILLKPTRIYVKPVMELIKEFSVHGLAHITGGGLTGNVPRVLPHGCLAHIHRGTWEVPEIFPQIQSLGQVEEEEMFRVFNMGIGFVVIVPSDQAGKVMARAKDLGETAFRIGHIDKNPQGTPCVTYSTGGG